MRLPYLLWHWDFKEFSTVSEVLPPHSSPTLPGPGLFSTAHPGNDQFIKCKIAKAHAGLGGIKSHCCQHHICITHMRIQLTTGFAVAQLLFGCVAWGLVLHNSKFELFEISKFWNILMIIFNCRIFNIFCCIKRRKNGLCFWYVCTKLCMF